MKDKELRKLLGFKAGNPYFTISDKSHVNDISELNIIKELKEENEKVLKNLDSLRIRIKQLECKHDGEMIFINHSGYIVCDAEANRVIDAGGYHWKECKYCGKAIERYSDKDETDCAKARYLKEKAEKEIERSNIILKKCKA